MYRSMPPISPAIMPAGALNSSPAHSGAASRTLSIASPTLLPVSVAMIATMPNVAPIVKCRLAFVMRSSRALTGALFSIADTIAGSIHAVIRNT